MVKMEEIHEGMHSLSFFIVIFQSEGERTYFTAKNSHLLLRYIVYIKLRNN